MSSHKHDKQSSIVVPRSTIDPDEPSGHFIEYQDLYHAGPTADRAYAKYVARGYEDGHDVEDWLASEREIEAEHREKENKGPRPASPRPHDHEGQLHQR